MPAGSKPDRKLLNAVLLMTGSALSFALMGAAVKASTREMPFLVSLFFRSVAGVIPLGIMVLVRQGSFRSGRQLLLFRRSLLGFLAMCLFFLGIERLPLSTAVVLNQSSPVFTVIFSAILLKEHRAVHVLPVALIAFLGVALLVGPEMASSGLWVSLTLLSAVLSALAYVTVKQLSATESSPLIVFYFSVWGTLFSIVLILVALASGSDYLDWPSIAVHLADPWTVVVLLCVGMFGIFGQLLMTASYARARASQVSPYSFFNPLFSYVIGVAAFSETVTLYRIMGGALVIAASALVPFIGSRSESSSKRG